MRGGLLTWAPAAAPWHEVDQIRVGYRLHVAVNLLAWSWVEYRNFSLHRYGLVSRLLVVHESICNVLRNNCYEVLPD